MRSNIILPSNILDKTAIGMAVLDKMAITILDKLAIACKAFPYKARLCPSAHDEIIDAVACAMAPYTHDEIAEAVL